MKRISTIVMALALVLSFSQCKKNEQNNAENQGEAVTITLDVSGASTGSATDGSKVVVNPNTGTVDFENNDQIIVASGGKYVGTLTYNGSLFTGAISNATEGYPLQFYFLGNVTPAETLTSGVTESCSVVISDQTNHLPVISAAPSNENYIASMTDYTAHLLNKCALVKFNVTTASEAAICVTGFNNKVTVNFSENTLTNGKESNGVITLPAGNGEKCAILLPQEALEGGLAYSEDGDYTGTRGAVPAVYENGYFTVGIEVNVTSEVNPGEVPVGAIGGKFTINADGDQVYFSQGNLQYQASTNTWRFAENQQDYIGWDNSNISPTYDGWIDLFGWGTSGWDNGNMYYQPYNTEDNYDNSTGHGYGPTDGTNYNYTLTGAYANADWGVYNAIFNGGNMPGLWRTLESVEWNYLFFNRSTPSGIRFAKAKINGENGVILLPDSWNTSVYGLNYTNLSQAPFNTNEITENVWQTMEVNGAIFLPLTMARNGTEISYSYWGGYWSATPTGTAGCWGLWFWDNDIYTNYNNSNANHKNRGWAVRLVHDVE